MIKDDIRTIQQRISSIESNSGSKSRATGSIVRGKNEKAALISRNNNHSNECSVCAVKFTRINSQVTTNSYNIDEIQPGTIAVNNLNMNSDTFFLGSKFRVLLMASITANVYQYYLSYKPLYNVPIVLGSTTVTNSITGNSFIMVLNKAIYYSNKLHHSIINPNILRFYGTMVWVNTFYPKSYLCLEACEVDTIDIIPNGTKIGFILHIPTEEDLSTLPNIEVISGSEWNPNTLKLGKLSINNDSDTFHSQQHTFGYHTTDTGGYLYLDNGTDEAVLHSINLALVDMGAKLRRKISDIVTPAADEIPARRNFFTTRGI